LHRDVVNTRQWPLSIFLVDVVSKPRRLASMKHLDLRKCSCFTTVHLMSCWNDGIHITKCMLLMTPIYLS
jgi:hypothetical protein